MHLKWQHKHLKTLHPFSVHLLPNNYTTWSFAECTHGGAEPMKNIYSNTQEGHNCSDLFISSSCHDFTDAIAVGWADHFTLWNSLCATCKDKKRMTPLASTSKRPGHMLSSLLNTYTVVSCVQEVKQLFCAILLCVGSRADAGFAQLQTLLCMYAVFRLLAFCSNCF